MKKFFLLFVMLSVKISFAQHAFTGIFMTAQDYAANKLSYVMDCDSSSGKVNAAHFIRQHEVEVVNDGRKIKLDKDSIFGYRDCKQNDFRFYNDERTYRILENKSMIIYSTDERENSTTGKTFVMVPAYFFSKTFSSEILPLNVINLKKAFPGNLKFHDLLDVEFSNDDNVSAFDSVHKMYKVNYLLSQSRTN
jgi:hypothetical protein